MVLGWVRGELELGEQTAVLALQQLVEDMEVPLSCHVRDHPGFLQEVVVDVAPHWCPLCARVCVCVCVCVCACVCVCVCVCVCASLIESAYWAE